MLRRIAFPISGPSRVSLMVRRPAKMFGITLYTPLFVQGVFGKTATGSGSVLTPLVCSMAFVSVVGSQIISRVRRSEPFTLCGTVVMTCVRGVPADHAGYELDPGERGAVFQPQRKPVSPLTHTIDSDQQVFWAAQDGTRTVGGGSTTRRGPGGEPAIEG